MKTLSSVRRHLRCFSMHPPTDVLDISPYLDTGEEAVVVGDGFGAWRACGLTMTWITKSFWILVSCRRVLSVSSLPEKNQRCWPASMSSWACSCFLSCPIVSVMLALRRRSLPVDRRTYRKPGDTRGVNNGFVDRRPSSRELNQRFDSLLPSSHA